MSEGAQAFEAKRYLRTSVLQSKINIPHYLTAGGFKERIAR